jgi:hypothetical protein
MKGFLKKAYEEKLEEIKNLRSKRFPPTGKAVCKFLRSPSKGKSPEDYCGDKTRLSESRGFKRGSGYFKTSPALRTRRSYCHIGSHR